MNDLDAFGIFVARAIERHARLVMEWRNDPVSRKYSFHTETIPWESFWPSYCQSTHALPDASPFFLVEHSVPVAFVSFRPFDVPPYFRKGCEISIMVDPKRRREGIGTKTLFFAQKWLSQQGYDDLYGLVREENEVSHHLFKKQGARDLGGGVHVVEETQERVAMRTYCLALTPPSLRKQGGVYVVAEIGSNWFVPGSSPEEEEERIQRLIDGAVEAGADAVKFQVFRPETLYAPTAGSAKYLEEQGISESMEDLFSMLSFPYEKIPQVAKYCEERGIDFLATPFSPEDFAAIDPYVRIHKLASYEIAHIRLLEKMAESQKPLLLSTGAATEEEIAWAVQTFQERGGKGCTLLQCTAKYPAPSPTLDLRAIPWLKRRFGLSVGLSDHSRDPLIAPLGAVALGATVIEKHYTLDRQLQGPDHSFSVELKELQQMVSAIRSMESSLGPGWKRIHDEEEELRSFARRGVQAIQPISSGDVLQEGVNIAILRPGGHVLGIHPRYIDVMQGKKAKRSILLGEGLQDGDWQ